MSRHMIFRFRSLFTAVAAAAVVALSGCKSSPTVDGVPVSDAMAAVSVNGVGIERVREAVIQTFRIAGYSQEFSRPGELIFDRVGSRSKQLQYGTYMGGPMYDRVKVYIDTITPMEHILRGDLFVVTNKGSMTGDDERPVLRFGIDELRAQLNQAKRRAESGY